VPDAETDFHFDLRGALLGHELDFGHGPERGAGRARADWDTGRGAAGGDEPDAAGGCKRGADGDQRGAEAGAADADCA
jgi:hypothetical protein